MHRIDTSTAEADKHGSGKSGFRDRNLSATLPVAATGLDADYFDMLQEEPASVVEATGSTLVKGTNTQLLTALRAMRRWDANQNIADLNTTDTGASYCDFAEGLFLAGFTGGSIYWSERGERWTIATTSPAQVSRAFAYGSSRYLAVGDAGQVASSTDAGDTWSTHTSGTANALNGVAWSGSTFVAVGVSATIITSTTGTSGWTARTADASFAGTLRDVIWDGSQFVMVGDGTIQTSPDGTTWTQQDSGSTYYTVAYGNGYYVAAGPSGAVANSTDAETWTSRSFAGSSTNPRHVVFDGHFFSAAGSLVELQTSATGETWTKVDSVGTGSAGTLAFGAGRLVMPVSTTGFRGSARALDIVL